MDNLIDSIMSELGTHMGFKTIKLNNDGRVHLSMGKLGELFIEKTPSDTIRFSLSRKHPYPSKKKYLLALELCHYSQSIQNTHIYSVGLLGENSFFFSTALDSSELVISEVMNTIHTLVRLQDNLGNIN